MKTVRILAVAAVATSLACSEGTAPGLNDGPELAKGKPDLTIEQVCETFVAGTYFSDLMALCASTADENTLFLSRNNADRDRWGLIGQLNRAGQKCSEDSDEAGAVGKLTEYRDKVIDLRNTGKISEPAGVDLAGGAQDLIDLFDPELTIPVFTCPTS